MNIDVSYSRIKKSNSNSVGGRVSKASSGSVENSLRKMKDEGGAECDHEMTQPLVEEVDAASSRGSMSLSTSPTSAWLMMMIAGHSSKQSMVMRMSYAESTGCKSGQWSEAGVTAVTSTDFYTGVDSFRYCTRRLRPDGQSLLCRPNLHTFDPNTSRVKSRNQALTITSVV